IWWPKSSYQVTSWYVVYPGIPALNTSTVTDCGSVRISNRRSSNRGKLWFPNEMESPNTRILFSPCLRVTGRSRMPSEFIPRRLRFRIYPNCECGSVHIWSGVAGASKIQNANSPMRRARQTPHSIRPSLATMVGTRPFDPGIFLEVSLTFHSVFDDMSLEIAPVSLPPRLIKVAMTVKTIDSAIGHE